MNCFALRHFPGIAHLVTPRGLLDGIPADTPIADVPVIAVDTETTGTDPRTDRVVEIAAIADNWQFTRLVNPGVPIPADATAVHGIHDADVASADRWSMVATLIAPNAVPLAYSDYDRTLIRAECQRHGVDNPFPDCEWLDPLPFARWLYASHRSRSLGSMCTLLGIQHSEQHRATSDAWACLAVWRELIKDSRMPRTYGQVVQMQRALARSQAENRRWR